MTENPSSGKRGRNLVSSDAKPSRLIGNRAEVEYEHLDQSTGFALGFVCLGYVPRHSLQTWLPSLWAPWLWEEQFYVSSPVLSTLNLSLCRRTALIGWEERHGSGTEIYTDLLGVPKSLQVA